MQQSSTPMLPRYQDLCVFHGCFTQGKIFQEMIDFMYIVHETLIFNVSHKGVTMKADDRPSGNRNTGQKETIFTDLFIPTTGFSNWFYSAEDPDSMTPVPVEAGVLRDSLKGSILAKDSLVFYILKSDTGSLHTRVVGLDLSSYKVDSSTKLLDIETIPEDLLVPINTPFYDLSKPVASFLTSGLASACKDAKAAKISELTICFQQAGLIISFGKASGNKTYPLGLVDHDAEPLFSCTFKVKKKFESLLKLTKLSKSVSVYASAEKPVLFSFNISTTGGKFNVYCVPVQTTKSQ